MSSRQGEEFSVGPSSGLFLASQYTWGYSGLLALPRGEGTEPLDL